MGRIFLSRLRTLASEPLVLGGAANVAASVVATFLNYAFQLALAHKTSVEGFSRIQSLLAAYMVLAVPMATLTLIVTKRTALHERDGDLGFIQRFSVRTMLLSSAAMGVLFLALLPFQGSLQAFFHLPSLNVFFLFALSILTNVELVVTLAVVQGRSFFFSLAFLTLLTPTLKLGLFFIFLSFLSELDSVLWSLCAANVATAAAAAFLGFRLKTTPTLQERTPVPPLGRDLGMAFSVNIAISLLCFCDVIYANARFPASQSAAYAAAAMIAKTLVYIPLILAQLMVPLLVRATPRASLWGMDRTLAQTLLLTLGLSASGLIVMVAGAPLLVALLFQGRYPEATQFLPYAALAFAPVPLLQVAGNYFVVRNGGKAIALLLVGVLALVGGIFAAGVSLPQMNLAQAAVGFLLVAASLGVARSERSRG